MGRMVPAAPTITLFRIAMGAPLKCRTKGETKAQSPKAPTIQLPTIICSISSARQIEYAAIRRPTATSSQRAPWIPRYSRTNGAMTNHTPSVKFIQHRAFIDVTYFPRTKPTWPRRLGHGARSDLRLLEHWIETTSEVVSIVKG